MIIGYDNAVNDLTITMSNESPLFPGSNLKDSRLSRFTKVLGTETRIVFSGASTTVTACFIGSHNLTATAVVKLEGHTSNTWTAPDYTTTLTYDEDIINKTIATQTYDYWSVYISDAANTEDVKIGGIFLGTYFDYDDISHSMTIDDIDTTVQTWSLSGQSYTDINHVYERYTISLDVLTEAEIETMREIVRETRRKPIWIYLSSEFPAIYGVYEGNMTRTRKFNDIYTLALTIREAK